MSREEIEKGSAPRRTLMISEASHGRIAALSDAHGVKHYEVIDALLDAVVPEAFQRAMDRQRSKRLVAVAERQRRRKLLEAFVGSLNSDDFDALIAGLTSQSSATTTTAHGE